MTAAPWTDVGWAGRELERLWRRTWLVAAHSARLAKPGDYVIFDLGRLSALVVRDHDGALRAFANACAHRGTRLLDGVGCNQRIRCPYHGWTYALNGELTAAPHVDPPPRAGLVPLPAAERFGFAWLAFSDDVEPLDAFLAPLAAELESRELGRWQITSEVTAELACNWKISVDAHSEALHVPTLHPEIADAVDWKGAEVTRLGPHAALRVAARRDGIGENRLLYVFPNTQLNLHENEAFVLRHRPSAERPDRCELDQIALAPRRGARVDPPRRAGLDDAAFGPITSADLHVSVRVQRGLATGALRERCLTESESILSWMMEEIERRLRG